MRSTSTVQISKAKDLLTARVALIALSLTIGSAGVYFSRPVSSKTGVAKATTSNSIGTRTDISLTRPACSGAVGFAESVPVRQMGRLTGRRISKSVQKVSVEDIGSGLRFFDF